LKNNDTVKILHGDDHPQYGAPGYALWYLWVVRHLPNNPYTGFEYVSDHKWLMEEGGRKKIWSPK